MLAATRRCALPLAAALVLLGSAACGDSGDATTRLRETSVDSSDTRAHRLAQLVGRSDTLSVLRRALRQAGLARELRTGGPYTLFAPTDQAFRQHWPGFDSLLAPAGSLATSAPQPALQGEASSPYQDSLRRVLQFHLVRGRFTAADIADSLRLGTLVNESLLLERRVPDENRLRLRVKGTPGPVPIRRTLEAQNGVLHVIPRPLRIPQPDTSAQGALQPDDTTGTSSPAGN